MTIPREHLQFSANSLWLVNGCMARYLIIIISCMFMYITFFIFVNTLIIYFFLWKVNCDF